MNPINRLLVVCIGSVCRSPTALGFFQAIFQERSISCVVNAAGIKAVVGSQPDEHVRSILLRDYAIDLSFHKSVQITHEMMLENNLILVMDKQQQQDLEAAYPFACGKVHLLGKWRKTSIPDPHCQSEAVFLENIKLIRECVYDWIEKLWVNA